MNIKFNKEIIKESLISVGIIAVLTLLLLKAPLWVGIIVAGIGFSWRYLLSKNYSITDILVGTLLLSVIVLLLLHTPIWVFIVALGIYELIQIINKYIDNKKEDLINAGNK